MKVPKKKAKKSRKKRNKSKKKETKKPYTKKRWRLDKLAALAGKTKRIEQLSQDSDCFRDDSDAEMTLDTQDESDGKASIPDEDLTLACTVKKMLDSKR